MNSHFHDGLRRRALARVVLAGFLVFPAVGAWLGVGVNLQPCLDDAPVTARRAPISRTSPAPQFKRGWPRKALIQTSTSVATLIAPAVRRDGDPQKEWAQVARSPLQPGSRLDICPEFTKPDSLRLRLMGNPTTHRAPPLASL